MIINMTDNNSFSDDFNIAKRFFENRQYGNAINIYHNLLAKDYNKMDVIPYIVNSYIALDDFDSCIEIFNKYLFNSDFNEKNIILNKCLNLLKNLDIDDYHFNLNSAKIFIQFEKFDDSIVCLNNILEKYPNDSLSSKLKAILLYDQDKLDESLDILNNLLNNNPNDYLALQYKGYILLNNGNVEEGIDVFKKLLSIYNKDYNIWRQVYFAYAYTGNLKESLRVNGESLKIFPDNYILWYDRFQLFESINDYSSAYDALEKVKELKPEVFND